MFQQREECEVLLAVAAYFYGVRIRALVLPVAGEYTIRVSERSDAHTGSFTVGVSDQPVAAGTEPIVPDAEALSRSLSPLGDVDRFVFEALRGQAFNILVTSLTDSIDLDALVIDSLGAIRASQIGGRHAMIANFVAPADDVYVIQVQPGGEATGVNVARTGDYTIELLRILVSPNLRVASVTPPSGSGIKSGDSVTISWTVENAGNAGTGDSSWTDRVVISPNPTLGDADDIVLGTFVRDGALAPGEDYTATHVVTLPQGIGGDFFVIVEADSQAASV